MKRWKWIALATPALILILTIVYLWLHGLHSA